MLPTKTQINLRIRAVWSESSVSAWRHFTSLATQNAAVKSLTRLRECEYLFDSSLCDMSEYTFSAFAAYTVVTKTYLYNFEPL